MKLIHCSDIHLDSRMESNLPPEKARERGVEICNTFARMVRYAAENGVAAVLIAGDLFDTRRVSARTVGYVMDQIRSAKDVSFLYLRGNHDENRDAFAGQTLPENFKTFGSAWTYFHYGDVTVAGLEMNGSNCLSMYDSLKLRPEDTNIVMLHGQVSTQPGEEQIAVPLLKNRSIHYLALGHLHSFQRRPLDDGGTLCYSGCLEGRGFDECGEKGFVLLDVHGHRVEAEFVPFASRTLWEVPVDITNLTTVSQMLDAMEQTAEKVPETSLVKFTLTGGYTLDTQKDLRFLQKSLASRFYFTKIKDESRLIMERADYEHDISLKGEFIRMVLASDKSAEDKEQMILWGIQALSGEEVAL